MNTETVKEILEPEMLRGTELSEAVNEFHSEQRSRIRYQLRIIAGAKLALEEQIRKECSRETIQVVEEFKEALKKRRPSFKVALERAQKALEELGKWENCSVYFDFHEMVKKKRAFGKIIALIKPSLLELYRWSDWRERIYQRHRDHEEEMLERLRWSVETRLVWTSWLVYVQGIGLALAAQVIGGFESALKPGETLGTHFKKASQMIAFAGLDINPETGKAWRRVKGQKLRYNAMLRSVLIGRLGSSFLKQKSLKSGYRRLYNQAKARLNRRFKRQGTQVVPSAKLPIKNGKRYEPKEMISKGHLHQMALRIPVKMFVRHFWEEIRRSEGLPCGRPYVIEVLGHPASSYIPPIRDKDI